MKILFLIVTSLWTLNLFAKETQDIVIKSRFNYESSTSFIKRLRTLLINKEGQDPYSQVFQAPIEIDLNRALDGIPDDTQDWLKKLQSVLRLKLFESDYHLIIEEFGYAISDFGSEIKPKAQVGRTEYVTFNQVKGLRLYAEKILFEVELKTTSTSSIKFDIELIHPEFVISPELMVELPMVWEASVIPNFLQLSITQINLQKVFSKVVKRPDLIDLNIESLVIPDVTLKVGNKEVSLDRNKIDHFFASHKDELKKGVLDLLNGKVNERLSNIIEGSPIALNLPSTFAIKNQINWLFNVQKLSTEKHDIMQADMDGYFCLLGELDENLCKNHEVVTTFRREISQEKFDLSMEEMDMYLLNKKANITLSVSEYYLNQLIQAYINAGRLERIFDGKNFLLGPEKVFVVADEKGENFSLYLDIIYKLRGTQRILVGRSELRFPVKVQIDLKIMGHEGNPHLQIQVKKLVTDDAMILDGIEEYHLPSNVGSVPRFRQKVLSSIKEDLESFQGQMLVNVELKGFKGTYLEEAHFFSDGLGRAMAILDLDRGL